SSSTAAAPLSSLMSNSATWPPSATMRRATARPSPETPPVTTARIGEDGMGGPGSKARILARRVGGGRPVRCTSRCRRDRDARERSACAEPAATVAAEAAPTTGLVSGAIRAQQAAREFVGVQAGREQEALADRHAEFEHEAPLRLRFDALGHQPQPQA